MATTHATDNTAGLGAPVSAGHRYLDGMRNAEYHAHPSLSRSQASLFASEPTPAHAAEKLARGVKRTDSMRLGNLIHTLVLEPHRLSQEYVLLPGDDGRTKKVRGAKEAAIEAGLDPIKPSDMELAHRCADAVQAHPTAAALLGAPVKERAYFWDWKLADGSSIPCRCKIDLGHPSETGTLVDLKSAEDASPRGFQRALLKYYYHFQGAFYLEGANAVHEALGDNVHYKDFAFIVVEKEPPYAVATYRLNARALAKGLDLCTEALDVYKSGVYPAYSEAAEDLDLPDWAVGGGEL